jgi:hypothetical protein
MTLVQLTHVNGYFPICQFQELDCVSLLNYICAVGEKND